MFSMENSQTIPKNKFTKKIASYLDLIEKHLDQVLGLE